MKTLVAAMVLINAKKTRVATKFKSTEQHRTGPTDDTLSCSPATFCRKCGMPERI